MSSGCAATTRRPGDELQLRSALQQLFAGAQPHFSFIVGDGGAAGPLDGAERASGNAREVRQGSHVAVPPVVVIIGPEG